MSAAKSNLILYHNLYSTRVWVVVLSNVMLQILCSMSLYYRLCIKCNDYYVNIVLNTTVETMYLINESNRQFFPCKGYKGVFLNSAKWSFARNKCIKEIKFQMKEALSTTSSELKILPGLLIVFTMYSLSFWFPKKAKPHDNQCDNNWICTLVPG